MEQNVIKLYSLSIIACARELYFARHQLPSRYLLYFKIASKLPLDKCFFVWYTYVNKFLNGANQEQTG